MTQTRKLYTTSNNSFFRNYYVSVIAIIILALLLVVGMVTIVLYQIFHKPLPVFRAVAPNGKMILLDSFNEPNLLPKTLLTWASKAAVAAYTFDFVNYTKQINAARPYFTPLGWNDYQRSIARLLQDLAQKQLFINGVVSGPPIISNQGELGKKGYLWRVQLPFLVTYQSSENTSQENFVVLMTIVKIPTYINPTGIGIDQFVMR